MKRILIMALIALWCSIVGADMRLYDHMHTETNGLERAVTGMTITGYVGNVEQDTTNGLITVDFPPSSDVRVWQAQGWTVQGGKAYKVRKVINQVVATNNIATAAVTGLTETSQVVKVRWLQSPVTESWHRTGKDSWETDKPAIYGQVGDAENIIGLREDGVVVWKKREEK